MQFKRISMIIISSILIITTLSGHNKTDDEVKQAAFQGGSKYIISYEINPQDWIGKSPEEISDFVFEKKK